MNENLCLQGKTAIVTGAASGIGQAIARKFALGGARVCLCDIRSEMLDETAKQIRANGGAEPVPLVCDVTDPAAVQREFGHVASGGRIDILVNSAGVSHIGTLETTPPEEFDRVFQVNAKGVYLCMQAAIGPMKRDGGGVILNLASIAATAGLNDRFAYSMSKGAVLAMTLSVAKDYLPHKIRCNAISPARIHTPFVDNFIRRNYPGQEAAVFAKLSQAQPIGRMGTPDEVAALALYLCSDAASFITGADIPLDGGFVNLRG